MTNETPTALEKVKNAITNKITALITAHNEDTSAHGLDNINDLIDVADSVSENDSRPVSSEAVYEEINDINEFIEWSLEQEDSNETLEQEVADLRELVMWIMNQDLDKDLETKLEQFLEEE